MKTELLENVYLARPFKIRNADEYDLENILDLFVDPTDGLIGPFDFSNMIIKGKMGSGKTMYLRANYAYYLHTLVPCLLEKCDIILPVYIKLSDFQSIRDPKEVYHAIIVKIIEEIVSVCDHLKSAEELARLHMGASTLSGSWSTDRILNSIVENLKCLNATEYVEKIRSSMESKGGIIYKFFDVYAQYGKEKITEIKSNRNPMFSDIVNTCKMLLDPFGGKLLILLDEVGSINKRFFRSDDDGDSYFETLMNQLRTIPYIRTKLAVYPNTFSDILKETRYGDIIPLECDIMNHPAEYESYSIKVISLIERYIDKAVGVKCKAEEVFEISVQEQLVIEYLVNASSGNMRRLVHLLDSSMNEAYKHNNGKQRVAILDVVEALKRQGRDMELLYQTEDIDFLNNLLNLCKSRSTYRFSYPNKGAILQKFTNNSEEYNIIEVGQYGTGRKGNMYYFDYAYCIYKDLPTHYIKNSEKIDKTRSREKGEPIKRIAQITDELLFQSKIPGKIDGAIAYLDENKSTGLIKGVDEKQYFFNNSFIIKDDMKKDKYIGGKVRFLPAILGEDAALATEIEIL